MFKTIQDYPLQDQGQKFTTIAWSPDGATLASCSSNGNIQLWDTATPQQPRSIAGEDIQLSCLTWSPDSTRLAAHTANHTIKIWDSKTGDHLRTLSELTRWVSCLVWSPDGKKLVSGSFDGTIRLWDAATGQHLFTLTHGHTEEVSCLLWSPDRNRLFSGSSDKTILIWDINWDEDTWQPQKTLIGHFGKISCMTWISREKLLASGSLDRTIRVWDPDTGREKNILQAHTSGITSISSCADVSLLASKADIIRFWSTETWEPLEEKIAATDADQVALAFHPHNPHLAILANENTVMRILDTQSVADISSTKEKSIRYTNAKIILVGEASVGKTGLSLVLTGQKFEPTPSSHGRHILPFDDKEPRERAWKDGEKLSYDTFLWDLAGQPSYRLIHQLHLKDIAVALVLFDYSDDTDPFKGVEYWNKALHQAQKAQGNSAIPMKKLLIAARTDRGGRHVNQKRIDQVRQDLGFDGYFETSAKKGTNIEEVRKRIKDLIDWDILPKVTLTDLFQRIKDFLFAEKKYGRVLSTTEELYQLFLKSDTTLHAIADLQAQFETCIDLVASTGSIHRLSFNNYVLLQPELIDAYASALVNSVSNDPDGLGSILEADALAGKFMLPEEIQRIDNPAQEKILLLAMIEDLLKDEVGLRDEGYLIFPSQSTREHPEIPDFKNKTKTLTFTFEGPVQNVYAKVAVRLSRSGLFMKTQPWKYAVVYTTMTGGTCGLSLQNRGEGRGKLTLFFDEKVGKEMRTNFERFVEQHLKRTPLPLQRERIFSCEDCGMVFSTEIVNMRRERGFHWIQCNVCDSQKRIWLSDDDASSTQKVEEMNRDADKQRDKEVKKTSLLGKIEAKAYDVFLSYNNRNRTEVEQISIQLEEQGCLPWFDKRDLVPGQMWQHVLEEQIEQRKTVAVFIGADEIGPWQNMEIRGFLDEAAKNDSYTIIPVILASCGTEPKIPIFLKAFHRVDFRERDPLPLEQLLRGIRLKKNS